MNLLSRFMVLMTAVGALSLLSTGCGGDASGSAATTAPATASAACKTAFDDYSRATDEGLSDSTAIRVSVIAALDACSPDEYVAQSQARYEGDFTLGDVISGCEDDPHISGSRPRSCEEIVTSADERWTKACAQYKRDWGKVARICTKRAAASDSA